MSSENSKTLAVYEKLATEYAASTLTRATEDPIHDLEKRAELMDLLRIATTTIPRRSAKVLEIGSADGFGAEILAELGFARVTLSDAVDSFLDILKSKGHSPLKFNLLTDDFPASYDLVFAWRTFVHFTHADAQLALKKIAANLYPGGRLVFNVQNSAPESGKKELWRDYSGTYRLGAERYFSFWTAEEIQAAIASAGLTAEVITVSGGPTNDRWFNIIAKK